jgi:deazaflavin-dependent oxidoreductase (nitroreductase family)
MKSDAKSDFQKPTAMERVANRAFGFFTSLGLAPPHNYLLQVRGRKSGRIYSTPVNLLEFGGKRLLVAPRGYTQWVRNAEAAGEVSLKRGFKTRVYRLRKIPNDEKPEVLKAYLDRFRTTVQRYFPIPVGSDPSAFVSLADQYPAFELLPSDDKSAR